MNRWLPMLAIALMCFSVAAVVLLAGRPLEDPRRAVAIAPPPLPLSGAPLEVVLATRWSPVLGYQRTRSFAECLQHETGRPVSVTQRGTYAETNALLATGRGDLALVCSGATSDARLRASMDAVYRLDDGSNGTYHAVVVVRADDLAVKLDALRGASISWTDPDSLTGFRAPRAALRAVGVEPDTFFGAMSFTHSHDASLGAVLQGIVRAAAVDEEVLRARKTSDLKVIWRSDPFPAPPLLVRKGDVSVLEALARIAARPECLADLGATRLVPTSWRDYDELAATIEGGR